MKQLLFSGLKLTFLSLILLAGVYTLLLLGVAQVVPGQGKGALIHYKGKTYYANIGQRFTEDRYFQGRPSAVNYNAAGSGASNEGPDNPRLLDAVQQRIDTLLAHNPGVEPKDIPVDLVTASASGLDPDISLKGALLQVDRIAAIRKIPSKAVEDLVRSHVEKPFLGIFGPEKINVLKLNIALDQWNVTTQKNTGR
jgi:K+-transporting ATPase ATPase C chain